MQKYIHAKVRKHSQYIQLEACMNNIRYRFSTRLPVNERNLEYVETHYKEILQEYRESHESNNTHINKDSVVNYGYKVLELESLHLKESTLRRYENVFKLYIAPHFSNIAIIDCSPKRIKEVFATKLSNISYRNKGIVISVLRKIFDCAISEEVYTKANPISCIKHRKNMYIDEERNKALSLNETMDILRYLAKDTKDIGGNTIDFKELLQLYLSIALLTGMRVNEILALKYEDIDLDKGVIKVYKTLSNNHTLTSTKTKNATREIEILDCLKEILETTLKKHRKKGLQGFIFAKRDSLGNSIHHKSSNTFYDKSNVNNKLRFINPQRIAKAFKNILQILHIADRTLYSTRHTFASLMLSFGEDLLWVSNMLGHKDVATTCKSYAKYIKTDKKRGIYLNTMLCNKIETNHNQSYHNIGEAI